MVIQRQSNDCVVTALANYTGRTYDEVLDLLDKLRGYDEGNGKGYYNSTYLFALSCLVRRETQRVDPMPMNGILRFHNTLDGAGHLVAVRECWILDGSAFGLPLSIEQHERLFPHLIPDRAWQ